MRLRTSGEGYEYFVDERNGTPAYHHRLVAIAEYGFDAVTSDKDVHHKHFEGASIPWLNGRDWVVPENWIEHRKRTLNNVQTAAD